MKQHILRTLILLLLPCVVLGAMTGWVVFRRGSARTEAISAELDRDIVWPGQRICLGVTLDPRPMVKTDVKIDPADVILVLDRSGSMFGAPIHAVSEAASALVEVLAGDEVHFAVVAFNHQPATIHGLSGDPAALSRAIHGIFSDGGTEFAPALERAETILRDQGRKNARPTMIFLSDGQSSGDLSIAERLHKSGISLYAIGYGSTVNRDQLMRIAGSPLNSPDPSMYVEAPSQTEVLDLFLGVGEEIAQALVTGVVVDAGTGPQVVKTLTTEYRFLTRVDPQSGRAEWQVPVMFGRPATLQVDLVPRTGGLFQIPSEPLVIHFADAAARPRTVQANTQPWALFLTWSLLFWLFLPALIYPLLMALIHLFRKPEEDIVTKPLEQTQIPRLAPTLLPRLPAEGTHRPEAVPTLLIGLGPSGRQTLTCFKDLILDIFDALQRDHIQLRQLDLHRDAYEGPSSMPVTFAGTALSDDEICLLPRDACNLVAVAEDEKRIPTKAHWLDRKRFEKYPRGQLNMAGGAHGDRALARLALWLDLAKGHEAEKSSGIADEILRAMDELGRSDTHDDLRQVILVFSPEEAVGGGWSHDITNLIRATIRERQNGDPHHAPPEVIAFILSQRLRNSSPSAAAWFRETDRLVLAGRYPMPVILPNTAAAGLMTYCLREQPFDAKLIMDRSALPEKHLYPQAADVLMSLVNRSIRGPLGAGLRSDLLEDEARLNQQGRTSYSAVGSQSVSWHVGVLIERLFLRFYQHLLSIIVCHRDEILKSIIDQTGRVILPDTNRLINAARVVRASVGAEPSPDGLLSLVAKAWPDDAAGVSFLQEDISVKADIEWDENVIVFITNALTTVLSGPFGMVDVAFLLREGARQLSQGEEASPESRQSHLTCILNRLAIHAEAWLYMLLGPDSISDPINPRANRPTVKGAIEIAAQRLAAIDEDVTTRAELSGRKLLENGEGNPDFAEERLYQTWLERWLGTREWEDALRNRVSMEVRAGQRMDDPGVFIVVLNGEQRRVVSIDKRDELEEYIRSFAGEWLAPLRDLSIFEKLANTDFQYHNTLAERLDSRNVANLFRKGKVLQRNYLALPAKPGLEEQDEASARAGILTAVRTRWPIGLHLSAVETLDLRTIRMLSVFTGGSSDDLLAWEGAADYVEGPESILVKLWAEACRRAPEARPLPVHPTLAMLGCVPDRLEAFAHAWGTGTVRKDGNRWILDLSSRDPAELGSNDASLHDLACAFCLGRASTVPIDEISRPSRDLDKNRASVMRTAISRWRNGQTDLKASLSEQLEVLIAVYFDSKSIWG